jgi:heme/copper-type cytochrome/quinol oxidase subunit 2
MFLLLFVFSDIARRFQLGFQDTATPVMSAILDLHSHVCFFLIIIFVFVSFQILDVLRFFRIDYYFFLKNISFF